MNNEDVFVYRSEFEAVLAELAARIATLEEQAQADRKREYLRHASLTRRIRELEAEIAELKKPKPVLIEVD